MKLDTERLCLIPLSMKHFAMDMSFFWEELNCKCQAELMEDNDFLAIIEKQFEKINDATKCPYHTIWFMTRKTDLALVGLVAFRDVANENEENEISYQLIKDFEHDGYMTEAVKALCGWALKQKGVSHVIAETKIDNLASQNVLKRCGFSLYKQKDTFWWRL